MHNLFLLLSTGGLIVWIARLAAERIERKEYWRFGIDVLFLMTLFIMFSVLLFLFLIPVKVG